jgi:mannose-1-phosphate guanylyltransferase
MQHLFAVILAGGSGTRFWPASRRSRPKQLLPLGPSQSLPLIAATVDRINSLVPAERVLIATGASLVPATRAALPDLPATGFLGEPQPKNTAACIGWAASIARRRDPNALVMVLPSDHHIADQAGFLEALGLALESAEGGAIATIGIKPTRPDTGYGYIEMGDPVRPGLNKVVRFVEKPKRDLAEQYVASGRFVWNGGMFFFKADRILAEIETHVPELAQGLRRIEVAAAHGPEAEREETVKVFAEVPSLSIDVAVMEKAKALTVVPASIGWTDLGSWESSWELAQKDDAGNACNGPAVVVDGKRNLLLDLRTNATKQVMVALGVHDLCIVQTDDAILVIPRDRSQDVRAVIEELTRLGHGDKL